MVIESQIHDTYDNNNDCEPSFFVLSHIDGLLTGQFLEANHLQTVPCHLISTLQTGGSKPLVTTNAFKSGMVLFNDSCLGSLSLEVSIKGSYFDVGRV